MTDGIFPFAICYSFKHLQRSKIMRWFIENWRLFLPKPWDAVLLAFVAIVSGAWVGTERQRKEKPAGLRTMALVALGSCAFTLVGYSFTSNTGDAGRVAAQIVIGIGFLGAGVVLRGAVEYRA